MREENYLLLRKSFFWLILLSFIFFTPTVVYYSLGYKFDWDSHKFFRTGIISIKTSPRGAKITVNGKKLSDTTPYILRELLPKEYTFILEKEGYYPYQMLLAVRPSFVSDINVVLVPKMKNIEKLKFDFNVRRFFVSQYFFGERIIIFSDRGIYFLDTDLKNPRKISSVDLGSREIASIRDLKESNNILIFWNKEKIWTVGIPEAQEEQAQEDVREVYNSADVIEKVFLGIRERYLIIQDGKKIIALDIRNPKAYFPVLEVEGRESEVFYDTRTETIYVKDRVPGVDTFSLFKIELVPLIREKRQDEKIS